METAVWIIAALIVYCYLGYPLLLIVISLFRNNRYVKKPYEPTVSLIVSAYNEESVILQKIENCLNIDYAYNKLEILIGSDGSTDETANLLRKTDNPRIKTVISDRRRGKTAMINRLATESAGEILVFTDAAEMFEKDALKILLKPLTDERIGCVSGCYLEQNTRSRFSAAGLYWRYEVLIRKLESRINTLLGASGQIYAIRRALFVPQPDDTILDDQSIPQEVLRKKYKIIFEKKAIAAGTPVFSSRKEFIRKRRTLQGNYQALVRFKDLLWPPYTLLFLQIVSHKIFRLLVPYFLMAILVISLIGMDNPFLKTFVCLQAVFYLSSIAGMILDKIKIQNILISPFILAYHIVLMNCAAVFGMIDFLKGRRSVLWERISAGE